MLLPTLPASLHSSVVRLEAENATLEGPTVATTRKGYSGTGYATGLTKPNARIVWRVRSEPGLYAVRLGYAAATERGFTISVNGSKSSGMIPATGDAFRAGELGKVELKAGENEIAVERGWGFYDVDYLELSPAKSPAPLKRLPLHLSDPNAGPEARRLYADLLRGYGKTTLSGQYETGLADTGENAFVERTVGRTPAIVGGDLSEYSPAAVAHAFPKDLVSQWIEAGKRGQALTLTWHWDAPADLTDPKAWGASFYTKNTAFDVQKALADPDGERYKLMLRDIDAIAAQLRRLQDAHVPVLFRPLHEAEGGWFWWGAKGPEACKALWRLVFDRLTRVDGIHNLVWVWNSPKAEWYPGDDVVDVMSVDRYPDDRRDALSADWEDLIARFDGRKPVALAEFPGAPDLARMRRFGERWLYFVSWYGNVGPRTTPPEILKTTYDSPYVRSLPATKP